MISIYQGPQDQGCVNRVQTDTYKSYLVINFSMRPPPPRSMGMATMAKRNTPFMMLYGIAKIQIFFTKHPITFGHKDDLQ